MNKQSAATVIARAGSGFLRTMLVAAIVFTTFVGYGLLNNAWYKVLAVRGGSMEPSISAGDLIVITRPPQRVFAGMVLTLQVDGVVVTHRVVELIDDGFITQGDANTTRDDFRRNDVRIVGEYRLAIPFLGNLVEPVVASGAWLAELDEAASSAESGAWVVDSTSVEDGIARLSWSRVSTDEADSAPTPDAGPSDTPEPTASPTPTPSAEATPSDVPAATPTTP